MVLDDGSMFHGFSFGFDKAVAGEVVFNTAMTGYPESLTDPSYAGDSGNLLTFQPVTKAFHSIPVAILFTIVTHDNRLRMNFLTLHEGRQAVLFDRERRHPVVSDQRISQNHQLPGIRRVGKTFGITGIDTRALTKKIREHGVMMGRIVIGTADKEGESGGEIPDYGSINYVDRVSCKDIVAYLPDGITTHYPVGFDNFQFSTFNSQLLKRVVLLDCGVKANIIRNLLKRNVVVIRVPWNYDFNHLEYDGLFLSNGPGDPNTSVYRSKHRLLWQATGFPCKCHRSVCPHPMPCGYSGQQHRKYWDRQGRSKGKARRIPND